MTKRSSGRRVAVVTGAAQGIGRDVALALAKSGLDLALLDISEKINETSRDIADITNVNVQPLRCDVTEIAEVEDAAHDILRERSRIDVLVNNAGIFPSRLFLDMTEAEWDGVINTNLKSNFNCCKTVVKSMIDAKWGRIISIASMAGPIVGVTELTHYCASKAGIVGFVRALALELASFGITVNAIAPGVIETPAGLAETTPEGYEQFRRNVPLGRWGKTSDVASLATFLASEGAGYITGQCLVVDGGYTVS